MYTITLIHDQQTIKVNEETNLEAARKYAALLAREGAVVEIRYTRAICGSARYNVLVESKTFKGGRVVTLKPIYPPLLEQLSEWAKPLKAARA